MRERVKQLRPYHLPEKNVKKIREPRNYFVCGEGFGVKFYRYDYFDLALDVYMISRDTVPASANSMSKWTEVSKAMTVSEIDV